MEEHDIRDMKFRSRPRMDQIPHRVALLVLLLGHVGAPWAGDLPVPCGGACTSAGGPSVWVSAGNVQAPTVTGGQMTIRQTSPNATLNWQSFDIGDGNSVEFKQPSSTAVALNRVWDPSKNPSQILGALKANGQVYLVNRSGILFGEHAQVDVASLVASSLDMTDSALNKGLVRALLDDRGPAFTSTTDADGNIINGDITIKAGANICVQDGGQILVFAPNISNSGTIAAPNGQTVLAAGNKVYLATSSDPNLRGMLVEVDVSGVSDTQLQSFLKGETAELPLGKVTNSGSISVGMGNASLVGLAVNQAGLVSATTSVRANGTISLRAADKQDPGYLAGAILRPTRGGKVILASGSATEVLPDYADTATTVDVNAQPQSKVDVTGHTIHLDKNSRITATAGQVNLTAQANPSLEGTALAGSADNDSRILVDDGAVIDVSGAKINLPADRLELQAQLHSDELKDSPQQRGGVLDGKTVTVDLRQTGVRDDGSVWVGTPLADTSGAIAAIQRGVGERSVKGGSVNFVSQGDVIVGPQANIDVSGGRIDYAAGQIKTTQLLSQGQLYDIGTADPTRRFDAVVGQYTYKSSKWNVTQTWQLPGASAATYSPAFSAGYDAGSVTLNTPRLILDGNVKGSVTAGPYQRLPTTTPQGGQLVVGYADGGTLNPANYRAAPVEFRENKILQGLVNNGFAPLTDALPEAAGDIVLRPSLFSATGVSRGVVYSNGGISVPAATALTLPAGGSLSLYGSSVDIGGTITVPGGSISADAGPTTLISDPAVQEVDLRAGALLDTRGVWTNDNPLLGDITTTPIWIDGGNVSLTSQQGDVNIEKDARIDASASAWLSSTGSIKGGKGGNITLAAATNGGLLHLDGGLSAYALSRGGSLSLQSDGACISSSGCSDASQENNSASDVLTLAPDFFRSGGFSQYLLTASLGNLTIAGDAALRPTQSNLVLGNSNQQQPSGTDIQSFSRIQQLPDYQRQAANVSFSTLGAQPAELRVEQGASIVADPGASISLNSSSRMWMDGMLAAPGGTVSLAVKTNPAAYDFVPSDMLWLGPNASIDVAGVPRLQPDATGLGLRAGEVLNGGKVSLSATSGYVIAQAGSTIDVSGSASTLDLPAANGGYTAQRVSSNAGSLDIKAAEGAVLEGAVTGQPGSATALGGTFSLTLDPNKRGEPINNYGSYPDSGNTYPHAPRNIDIVAGSTPSDLSGVDYSTFDWSFTDNNDGVARLRTSMLDGSGFDAVQLAARNLLTNESGVAKSDMIRSPGVISVSDNLQMGRSLVIDAPVIKATAPDVTLAAPYVAVENTDVVSQAVPAPVGGDNKLSVDAQWLDLIGATTVSGAGDVVLHTVNDLRLRAPPKLDFDVRALTGSFASVGKLELDAGQLYPASLTDFTFNVADSQSGDGTGSIIVGGGKTAEPVLSAGGAVRMRASKIQVGGVIKAPFGAIDLQAEASGDKGGNLILAPGGLLSTSGDNQIIPLGHTEGGLDWSYNLGNTQKLVLSADLDPVPQQNIQLTGNSVQLQQGAGLDVSGGGDIQTYEFVPGVGGSHDVLSSSQATGSYAILPSLGATIAPFDHEESAGFAPLVGTTVYLGGGGSLAAGEYALLPPRYALLPGAFLITEMPAYRDLPTGQHLTLLNGLPVVAGNFGVAGTGQRESRNRAFSIMSSALLRDSSAVNRPAEYTLSLAGQLLATQNSGSTASLSRLPADAGLVGINAQSDLDLSATLNGAPASGGRGAALDIAAPNIVVTGPDAGPTSSGMVPISDTSLNDLGAESILLGGSRKAGGDGSTDLNVVSSEITVGANAAIEAPELLLAAKDHISVEQGATISGKGTIDSGYTSLAVNGDGALLRVSGGKAVDVKRSNGTGSSGTIDVVAGATLQAQGSANINATKDIKFAGNLAVSGASLAIGAPHINLGDAPADAPGFTIDAESLNKLGADQLLLAGVEDINFYDGPQINATSLILDAPSLVAHSGDGSAVTRITAQQVTLQNSSAVQLAASPDQVHGQLNMTADDIVLAAGDHNITGFDKVTLTAHNSLLGQDTGNLQVAGSTSVAANLTLDAGVISGERGATTAIAASGDVAILGSQASAALSATDIGASLNISGATISDSGRIIAPAGLISLTATGPGGITIADGAKLDAGGVMRQFDTAEAFAPAGSVSLKSVSGDVTIAQGASVNVAGASGSSGRGGDAGRINIAAPQGAISVAGDLSGSAVAGRQGGSASLDGKTISDLNALNSALNAAGFNNERLLRIRQGDVDLTSDVNAHQITVTVDGANGSGGALSIEGALNAAGDKGGQVELAAHGDITLYSGAVIDASAGGAGRDGGAIVLTSQSGGVKAIAGSSITAAGGPETSDGSLAVGRDGTLNIGVDRSVLSAWLGAPGDQTVALDGATSGLREIVLEGTKTYDYGTANVTLSTGDIAAGSAQAFLDASTFMQSASAIATALGRDSDPQFHVRPAVTIQTAGDLTLDTPWDLYDWRFGGEPGYLSLRAGGNLKLNQTLSDGMAGDVAAGYGYFLDQPAGESWSYRLTAGADLSSASSLAVVDDPSGGSLFLGSASNGFGFGTPTQTAIRAGTGNIDIAAAGDVKLANDSSVIYTMGVPVTDLSPDMQLNIDYVALQSAALAEHGGNISITAGGDVVGAPSDQLVNDWLWRIGSLADDLNFSPTMWGVNFNLFRQGVGALSGGDVTIKAVGNIDNVSAAIPTMGVPVGKTTYDNVLSIRGGGDLKIAAGGDIGGGVYYVGRGTADLSAGGNIRAGTDWNSLGAPLHTTLALGDGTMNLTARQDLAIETVFNPTILPPSPSEGAWVNSGWLNDFLTYSPSSAVNLQSITGDAVINGNVDYLSLADKSTMINDGVRSPDKMLVIFPPSLSVEALAGDIISGYPDQQNRQYLALVPAAQGQLQLLAQGNVKFYQNGYLLSDADPSLFPTPLQPQRPVGTVDPLRLSLLSLLNTYGKYSHADVPLHSAAYADTVSYQGPRSPALIMAQSGNIDMSAWLGNFSNLVPAVYSAKPLDLIAGGDILNPSLAITHSEADDISMVSAGGDITYTVSRNGLRQIISQLYDIAIDGPGNFLAMAGGTIDLQASGGIETRGNTVDPVLADAGANITVMSGLLPTPNYDAFITQYLEQDQNYRMDLSGYLGYLTDQGITATNEQMVQEFRSLPLARQIPLLTDVLFKELRAAGRQAANGNADFTNGYDAIDTLFTGADPAANPHGDTSLYFSRVYTLDGGDINILAPNGVVNVGLATPPASFGIAKSPSQLGIVAQRSGDVNILSGGNTLVNQSRVFAADGGSILMWSSAGNIDAGRGAKTAISAPPPVITYDPKTGFPTVVFPPALAGSGIRAFITTPGRDPGDVDLFAPVGVVNASDAGIGSAGNVTIAATEVIGAGNIDVGGVSVGVPVADTSSLAAGLTSVSNVTSNVTKSTENSLDMLSDRQASATPLADAALTYLDVVVFGLGDQSVGSDALSNTPNGN